MVEADELEEIFLGRRLMNRAYLINGRGEAPIMRIQMKPKQSGRTVSFRYPPVNLRWIQEVGCRGTDVYERSRIHFVFRKTSALAWIWDVSKQNAAMKQHGLKKLKHCDARFTPE
jgi:hypothetical protein